VIRCPKYVRVAAESFRCGRHVGHDGDCLPPAALSESQAHALDELDDHEWYDDVPAEDKLPLPCKRPAHCTCDRCVDEGATG
jgi:hypothetical protein